MAAFGVPVAHEDDAERAIRAALAIMDSVDDLGLVARAGIEAGEVVADDSDSTFATGEAVNVAARLQQAAEAGAVLVGPAAHRLTLGRFEMDELGPVELRGLAQPVWAWRPICPSDGARRGGGLQAPLVGRDFELELLENTLERCIRDRRAHLFTIYGDPGVGKSRLVREFTASLEGVSALFGRSLPYGEGVTYWAMAEMVKAAAGIRDDEPAEEALEKLRATCEIEAVADLLGLASGILAAVEGDSSQEELAWAARAWAEKHAEAQPLVLVFEDLHWAEEPLLDLIEHLASWVRDAPLLIVCLARPDLLDVRPQWGGGRLRATSIELAPLAAADAEQLLDTLLAEHDLPSDVRSLLLEKTEGNPLYVEETIRMLLEDGEAERIPDSLQALIAARIDHLPPEEKTLLQRASALGRIFYRGALESAVPQLVDRLDDLVRDLVLREFLTEEQRSNIAGEHALRFKHVLIHEVAYAGLSKSARAELHETFARWLEGRGEELLEIRAYHLDQAAMLHQELDGAVPAPLAELAAATLEKAARRALSREAYHAGRKLALRALAIQPTLRRRYTAARAAWRLGDFPTIGVEMEQVLAEAEAAGDRFAEGMALTALGRVALYQRADATRAQELADRALAVLAEDDHPDAHFEATSLRADIAAFRGDWDEVIRYLEEAFAVALASGRKDLQTLAAQGLATRHLMQLELDEAEALLERALGLAEESGSLRARSAVVSTLAAVYRVRGRLDVAEATYEEARRLHSEIGSDTGVAHSLLQLGRIAEAQDDPRRAEKLMRESIRLLKPLDARGYLCEAQRSLAMLLAREGKLEEAEKLALAARESVGVDDALSICSTAMALGVVRAVQGRDAEAESILRDTVAAAESNGYPLSALEPLRELVQFLRERGRDVEAAPFEERLAELSPEAAVKAA